MASSDQNVSSLASNNTESTKAKRGKVVLNRLSRRRGKGIFTEVEFNDREKLKGKNAAEMQSYIGMLTREHVKINIEDWRDVSDDVKKLIWESVKASYNVPDEWKYKCLNSANTKWRTWKTRLHNTFIRPNINDQQKLHVPPPNSGIRQDEWDEFVKMRTSDEFQKWSDAQRERVSKHEYPHCMSRKGYANLEEEMKDELLNKDKFSRRGMVWRRARMSKDGKVNNDKNKEAIEKMDEVLKEKEEGKFSTSSSNDLLAITLEKPDRPGRVRGVGAGITYTQFFKSVGGKRDEFGEYSKSDLLQMLPKRDEVIHDLKVRLTNVENRMDEKDKLSEGVCSYSVKKPKIVEQEKVSMTFGSSVKAPPLPDEQEKIPIKAPDLLNQQEKEQMKAPDLLNQQEKEQMKAPDLLNEQENEPIKAPTFIDERQKRVVDLDDTDIAPGKAVELLLRSPNEIVAYGTMMDIGDKLHGAPMPAKCFRVSVDEVVHADELLPFRVNDEIVTVGNALGTHVAWPYNLVVERSDKILTPAKKRKVGNKLFVEKNKVRDVASLPPSLMALHILMENAFNDGEALHVTMDEEVFGINIDVWIMPADVIPLCNLEPITGNCVLVYIWHLYRSMKNNNLKKVVFVNPFGVSHSLAKSLSLEDRARTLADRLMTSTSKQLVLAPWNTGDHWILTIIDPHKEKVYLMDPLGVSRARYADWVKVVQTAMNIFKSNHGSKSNIKKALPWKGIEGNKQPDGKQCGFYVMRYMKQIVEGFGNDKSICLT